MDEQILKSHQAITDFCATGIPPEGVRPQVAELLAQIVDLSTGISEPQRRSCEDSRVISIYSQTNALLRYNR